MLLAFLKPWIEYYQYSYLFKALLKTAMRIKDLTSRITKLEQESLRSSQWGHKDFAELWGTTLYHTMISLFDRAQQFAKFNDTTLCLSHFPVCFFTSGFRSQITNFLSCNNTRGKPKLPTFKNSRFHSDFLLFSPPWLYLSRAGTYLL